MINNPIKTIAQAKTMEQYLEILNDEMMDDDISLEELQRKHHKAEEILVHLQDFHQNRSIQLVVDNTAEEFEIDYSV